jgi:hypothetical protein
MIASDTNTLLEELDMSDQSSARTRADRGSAHVTITIGAVVNGAVVSP